MDWERFSIEHLSSSIVGLNLDQIRAIAEEAKFAVQFSDRLFQDKYVVAAHGGSCIINPDTGEPVVFGPDFATTYLIDISDGSTQKILEEGDSDYDVVAVDVSPDKETAFIMMLAGDDEFPTVSFIGKRRMAEPDCMDLIGAPVAHKEANPRWSEEDDDTIVYHNWAIDGDVFLKVDWKKRKVSSLPSSSR